jgi:Holliday junction resolvase RusA-like endonuclease
MNNYSKFLDLTASDDEGGKEMEVPAIEPIGQAGAGNLLPASSKIVGMIYGKPERQAQRLYNRRTNRYYDPTRSLKKRFVNLLRLERLRRYGGNGVPIVPLEGPLYLFVAFKFRATKPHHKGYHIATPDLDNLLKFFLDAMQQAGYFHNDCQVVNIIANKKYADESIQGPHTYFSLKTM